MVEKKLPQKKILVVDDMSVHREMLFKILNKAKFLVTLAESGPQAIEAMSKQHFDIVLLDVEMPHMNGFEVCNVMRNTAGLKEIPVIFVTSYGQIENKISGFGIGGQDFITKPFNSRELLVRINTHLLLKHKTDLIKNMNKALEEKNKSITQSIEYSFYIQQALLPPTNILDKFTKDKFIFFKSRDLIGGDFYWFRAYGSKLYIAIADCTGHGVPGALMSVLGISGLNEIMNDGHYHAPNEILNKLRQRNLKIFHRKTKALYDNDGMDMAICLIDFESMKLQYAGANIPLYLMRKNEAKDTYELIKRASDRLPIGNHPNAKMSFTNHYIDLKENDRLYLFTDGYTSQFGGECNKTFKSRRLVELLSKIQNYSVKDQKPYIEKKFLLWKGENDQVDDVLAIGIQMRKYVLPKA
jgi:CheY-like chemotaxis protein